MPNMRHDASENVGLSLPVQLHHRQLNNFESPLSLQNSNHHPINDNPCAIITAHPKHQDLGIGDEILLVCKARTCTPQISWQWYHNYSPIADGTKYMLMIPSVQTQHQGIYHCVIRSNSEDYTPVKSSYALVNIAGKKSGFHASDKIALLIGNDDYDHFSKLPAAARDVKALTEILQNELNFKTFSFVNLNFVEMHIAFKWFCELSSPGCYCLFYFVGHGYENDRKSYMIPVDAPYQCDKSCCVEVNSELENLKRRCSPDLVVALLDNCRKRNLNDPPTVSTRSSLLQNMVFAYATMESQLAFEESSKLHGIFFKSLMKHLTKPKRVSSMLSLVQEEVQKSEVQFAEVQSTLCENRRLTDPIIPGDNFYNNYRKWQILHGYPSTGKPLLLDFGRRLETRVEVHFERMLTNMLKISVKLANRGNFDRCRVYLDLNAFHTADLRISAAEDYPDSVTILNLQKLKSCLPVQVVLCCSLQSETRPYRRYRYLHNLSLPFTQFWRTR